MAAGPEALEDYFQKGGLLGQKGALNLWYIHTRPNSKTLFPKKDTHSLLKRDN